MKERFQVLYTRLKRRNANDIERLFKVCAVLHNMVLAYDPVGAGPRDFEMHMRHLHAERELDDRAEFVFRRRSSLIGRQSRVFAPCVQCTSRSAKCVAR